MEKGTLSLAIYRSSVWVFITVFWGLMQGCASFSVSGYGPDKQSKEDFEKRVEAAFRLENSMTSEAMALQGGDDVTKGHEAFFQAEQIMQKKCGDLNDYVSRDIDGERKSFLLLKRVENSVLGCEIAAHRVEALLNALNP